MECYNISIIFQKMKLFFEIVTGVAIGFIGTVGAIARSVAQLFEADARAVADAQQFTQQTLFRISLRFRTARAAADGRIVRAQRFNF